MPKAEESHQLRLQRRGRVCGKEAGEGSRAGPRGTLEVTGRAVFIPGHWAITKDFSKDLI